MLRSARIDAARSDGVADRLLDAVLLRDLEVVAHAVEAAGRDRHDDVVGAFERRALIGRGRHAASATPALRHEVTGEVAHVRAAARRSMSSSTISASASDGVFTRSQKSFGTHWKLPPPMTTIRGATRRI